MANFDEIYQKLNGKQIQVVDVNYGDWKYLRLDGENLDGRDLVSPVISSTWGLSYTPPAIDGFSPSANSIKAETGSRVSYSGTFKYSDAGEPPASYRVPQSCSGNWGSSLPAVNVSSSPFTSSNVSVNTTYTVNLIRKKDGFEVSGNRVVPAVGNMTKSATASVTFLNRWYFGSSSANSASMTEAIMKTLAAANSKTLTNTKVLTLNSLSVADSDYFHYCYPTTYGPLSSAIQDGVLPVLGAFTMRQINITNAQGTQVSMYVYSTNQKGAFKNIKLEFK